MSTSLVTKILRAVADLPQSFRRTPNPRIVMTLLVKNEEDMIERHLQYHKQMGVDAFIVTDNNSTDHTPEILARYVKKGWIVEVIEEKSSGYEQKKWVDRMAWLAKTKYHADWIINADADEFWYAPSGNLKNELGQTDRNVLRCCLYNMLPDDARPYWQWDKRVLPIPQPNDYNLSPYSITDVTPTKWHTAQPVICRFRWVITKWPCSRKSRQMLPSISITSPFEAANSSCKR